MPERIRFYIHPTAREAYKQKAVQLSSRMPESSVQELFYPLEPVPETVQTVVTVGGDGTVRSVMEKLLERDDPGVMLVIKGGSQNGFYRSLVSEGTTVQSSQIARADTTYIRLFHPGMINEHMFAHIAETGSIIEAFCKRNEALRSSKIPRAMRAFVAGVQTVLSEVDKNREQPLLRVFATGANMGLLRLFPQQELYADNLSMLSVDNVSKREARAKMILFLYNLVLKERALEGLAETSCAAAFVIDDSNQPYSKVGLGGDIFPLAPHVDICVRRSEKPLRAAALLG